MGNLFRRSVGFMLVGFILFLSTPGWAEEELKAMPVAKNVTPMDSAFDQAAGFVLIPLHVLLAVTYAPGEQNMKGNAYKGEYARHGYYRHHARWWDPFFYHHD